MRPALLVVMEVAAALLVTGAAVAQQPGATTDMSALPTGAKITVMQGKPETGPSTMLMSLPAGYVVALHRHPTDESVLVRSGTYIIKYGTAEQTLSAGQKATIKANVLHSERAVGPTVIEVQSAGVYSIIYVPSTTTPKAVTP